jgi:hypothetical protein
MKDNWKDRSEHMKCRSCMWYVAKAACEWKFDGVGRCRRHAPTIGGWPVILCSDWCGDHRLNENYRGEDDCC